MNKPYLSTILLILLLGSSFACAKDDVSTNVDNFINAIELRVQASIESDSLNDTQKYKLYALAAREVMGKKHYEKALQYYDLALASNLDKGMEEAFYNKLFIKYQLEKSADELTKSLNEFEHYLKKYDVSEKYSYILSSWKLMLSTDPQAEMTISNSLFGQQFSQKKVKRLVKDKKFAQALQLLPDNLGQSNINLQIQSDILKTIVFGRNQKLYCDAKLKKYPNSLAYTMQICRYLKDSQSVKLSDLETRITKQSPKRLFWLEAMKEIK